ncbi:MAG: anhydro-N-acetylmuramic acid kinase [Phycisphaerales bacterium JB050]
MTRVVFGAMTGTSMDGLDVAAIQWASDRPPRLLGLESDGLGEVGAILSRLATGQACSASEIGRAAQAFAESHIQCMQRLAERVGPPDLIAVHGQTVFHQPPASWQLLNPWPIARAFLVPVVSDLRGLDLASAGQGAPITPLSDSIWFGDPQETRVVLNLGGFANATLLPAGADTDQVRGFDICACNHVLNHGAMLAIGEPFDRDGAMAQQGKPSRALVERLIVPLRAQASAGRSLGSVDDSSVKFETHGIEPADLLASAVEGVATVIAEVLAAHHPDRVILAGGGARNVALVEAIGRATACEVVLSDSLGMPVEAREGAAIATLGALAAQGKPITLPAVTGRAASTGMIDGLWCLPRAMADASGVWRRP